MPGVTATDVRAEKGLVKISLQPVAA